MYISAKVLNNDYFWQFACVGIECFDIIQEQFIGRFGLYIILKRKLLWILALYKAVALALMPNEWRYYGIEKANLVKNIQKFS